MTVKHFSQQKTQTISKNRQVRCKSALIECVKILKFMNVLSQCYGSLTLPSKLVSVLTTKPIIVETF